MIDNTLYFSTMFSRVVALDAETGAEKWVYDPKVYEDARGGEPGWVPPPGRGVSAER